LQNNAESVGTNYKAGLILQLSELIKTCSTTAIKH